MNSIFIKMLKKTELLSALACRLTVLTGKSKIPIHPKHLINNNEQTWLRDYLKKSSVLLDAGCGSGQHSLKNAKYVKSIYLMDNDKFNLSLAKQSAQLNKIKNVKFIEANLEKEVPLNDNSVDAVILFDILEHLNYRQNFLKEIRRVAKRNGYIFVAIPNKDSSWKKMQREVGINSFSDPDHKIEYSDKTISKELQNAGFLIKNIKPISYDTPLIGFIDLVGGISLPAYKLLSNWKSSMLKKHPQNAGGFMVVGVNQ